jgi:hypothetical protein
MFGAFFVTGNRTTIDRVLRRSVQGSVRYSTYFQNSKQQKVYIVASGTSEFQLCCCLFQKFIPLLVVEKARTHSGHRIG